MYAEPHEKYEEDEENYLVEQQINLFTNSLPEVPQY